MAATWTATIGRLGVPTGDGRIIAPQGISNRELPLPLSWQRKSSEGHEDSVVVGVMTDLNVDYMAGLVNASGYWLDPATTPEVVECMTLAQAGVIGPSMDAGAVTYELSDFGDLVVFSTYEIAGATLVTVPAFAGLSITVGEPEDPPESLDDPDNDDDADGEVGDVEAEDFTPVMPPMLLAAAAPFTPPAAWFDDPSLEGPTPLTITDDGRVYGSLAAWSTCHVGLPGCVTPPVSRTGYAYFTTGAVRTAEGTDVPVGHLTVGTGHADPQAGFRGAAEHYDHTGATVAVVAAGEDQFGIWVAGAIVPEASVEQVEALRRSPLSGDWRQVAGNLELVAALAVNVPGFPVPRARAMVTASGEQLSLVASARFDAEPEQPEAAPVVVSVEAAESIIAAQKANEARRRRTRARLAINGIGRR